MEPKLSDIIREGDDLNMSTTTKLGGMIRHMERREWKKLTGLQDHRCCPNHDAPVIKYNGTLYIGDCAVDEWKYFPWPCHLTSVEQYEQDIASGKVYAVRVMRVPGITPVEQAALSNYWMTEVQGEPYDIAAFPGLALTCILGDVLPRQAGWPFAHFCTESYRLMWRDGAKRDIYQTKNATPLTTYARALAGKLENVAYFNDGKVWVKGG
jgi:hypothetical protein